MGLIEVLLVLAVAGLCLWLVQKYIPMQPPFPTIINVVVVIAIILWLLNLFGLVGHHRYHFLS